MMLVLALAVYGVLLALVLIVVGSAGLGRDR